MLTSIRAAAGLRNSFRRLATTPTVCFLFPVMCCCCVFFFFGCCCPYPRLYACCDAAAFSGLLGWRGIRPVIVSWALFACDNDVQVVRKVELRLLLVSRHPPRSPAVTGLINQLTCLLFLLLTLAPRHRLSRWPLPNETTALCLRVSSFVPFAPSSLNGWEN